jgi:MFS family permease
MAITRESLPLLLALIGVTAFLTFGYLGVTYAALQNLMHPRMRVTTFAVLNVVYGLASALGPLLLGALSDRMALSYGPAQGLAVAMAIGGALYVWAGLHYLLAARRLPRDSSAVHGMRPPPVDRSDITGISEITEIGAESWRP